MFLDDDARAELAALEAAHRRREPRVVETRQGPTFVLDGREVINLSSNDYLSLAGDLRIARVGMAALEESGVGSGASRLIAGTHRAHVALERAVVDWMRWDTQKEQGVRLFNSGFAANTGVLATLVRAGDAVFSDELNHASIIDGCRLSRANVVVYPHLDVAALDEALAKSTASRKIVVTESLFSMDGDIADLAAIASVCKRRDAALIVDEAHAVGAYGPEGRGLAAEAAVVPDVLVGTFGKALGTFGAFVVSSHAIAELLWNRARSFVFSTALPPAIPAATLAALEIVRGAEGLERRRRLVANARAFRELVPRAGGARESAIAPIRIASTDDNASANDRRVMELTRQLLDRGVFAQGIRPPTVPEGTARIRASLSAAHSVEHLEQAAKLLR